MAERVLPIVGANVVKRREQLGLSQRALVDKAGVDRVFYRDVEMGKRAPTVVFLAKLADALDTTVSALTRGT